MNNSRMWSIPLGATILVCGLLILYALRTGHKAQLKYDLPADHSPESLLQFMRSLDGSLDQPTTVFGFNLASSNIYSICQAVLTASDCLREEYPSLATAQQREASYYRLKYLGWSLFLENGEDTSKMEKWVQESQQFLSTAEAMDSREQVVAENVIRLTRHAGRHGETLEFVRWLELRLESQSDSSDMRALNFANKIKRIVTAIESLSDELELTSQTLQGETFDLKTLRGKVVLIEFWGTRCQPCIRELPALRRLYQSYRERGFEIVGICIGSEPERTRRFTVDHKLPWIQLCHDPPASQECNLGLQDRFMVDTVPTTLLLDTTGKVIALGVRPMHAREDLDLEHYLKRLLQ